MFEFKVHTIHTIENAKQKCEGKIWPNGNRDFY